jgi:hypothetical protein
MINRIGNNWLSLLFPHQIIGYDSPDLIKADQNDAQQTNKNIRLLNRALTHELVFETYTIIMQEAAFDDSKALDALLRNREWYSPKKNQQIIEELEDLAQEDINRALINNAVGLNTFYSHLELELISKLPNFNELVYKYNNFISEKKLGNHFRLSPSEIIILLDKNNNKKNKSNFFGKLCNLRNHITEVKDLEKLICFMANFYYITEAVKQKNQSS